MSDPQKPDPIDQGNPITQQVQYSHVAARVPERGNRGAFANAALVITGVQEFACDFVLRMVPPPLLAARVVMPYSSLQPVVKAISENLENYRSRFGVPVTPPQPPPNAPQPNIAEIYDQLKISDEVAVGSYANTLMISHAPGEFCMDFIFDLFPKPVVTQRIYMSASQVPGFLGTLQRTLDQLMKRQQPPPTESPAPPPPETPPAT
jgi:hypothetical protein